MPEITNFKGTIEAREGSSRNPTHIIAADENWDIQVEWTAPFSVSEGDIWNLTLYLETIGKGPQIQIPEGDPLDIPVQSSFGSSTYRHEVKIEAGDMSSGVYKVLAVLSYKRKDSSEPPIIGIMEGPILQVYSTSI